MRGADTVLAATLAAAGPYSAGLRVTTGPPARGRGWIPVRRLAEEPDGAVGDAMAHGRARTDGLDARTLAAQVVQQLSQATQPIAAALGACRRAVAWQTAHIDLRLRAGERRKARRRAPLEVR